jgi:hypothetical protein
MPTGYSRSPKLLKGALIEFSAQMLMPMPNIIVFQYNPETMTRTLSPWAPPQTGGQGNAAANETPPTAQPNDPEETFSLTLELDAADALEFPEMHPVAAVSGVADRLAALELLLYPTGDASASLLGSAGISFGGGSSGALPEKKVPVVLFFWGPGRIVPVRITSFSVEEQAFSPLLYPIRAKVIVGMKVLEKVDGNGMAEKIANGAYKWTKKQKQVLGTANLANGAESIMGMLPL